MRLILILLATAQMRLARYELARGDMLMDDADAAYARARTRLANGNRLADRAGMNTPDLLPRR